MAVIVQDSPPEPPSLIRAGDTPAPSRCDPQPFRWMEVCGPADARARGALRYLSLENGQAWVAFGGEARLKTESIDHPDLGVRNAPSYTVFDTRLLVHGDLRSSAGPRLFVQLSLANDRGRKPASRPFDQSAIDLAQAFVELPLNTDSTSTRVRLGRQELSIGQNRLVGNRDAANLRRAFDMAELEASLPHDAKVTLFAGRPVLNKSGAFDDEADTKESFTGGDAHTVIDISSVPVSVDGFAFRRSRARAVYQSVAGSERRYTAGFRVGSSVGAWDGAAQAAYQTGSVGSGQTIRASGFSVETGYRLKDFTGKPRLAVAAGRASGDKDPTDGHLGTFDPVYPNLGYFTDAPVFYPGNTWDVQPSLTVDVIAAATVQVGVDVISRLSERDALYGPPGVPLVVGGGTGGHHAVNLAFAKFDWHPSPRWGVTAGLVHGAIGSFVRAGGGKVFSYGFGQIAYRY